MNSLLADTNTNMLPTPSKENFNKFYNVVFTVDNTPQRYVVKYPAAPITKNHAPTLQNLFIALKHGASEDDCANYRQFFHTANKFVKVEDLLSPVTRLSLHGYDVKFSFLSPSVRNHSSAADDLHLLKFEGWQDENNTQAVLDVDKRPRWSKKELFQVIYSVIVQCRQKSLAIKNPFADSCAGVMETIVRFVANYCTDELAMKAPPPPVDSYNVTQLAKAVCSST